MRRAKQQSGFAILELVLVLVIIAIIVVVGLWAYNNKSNSDTGTANTTPTTSTQSPVAHNVSAAPKINSTSDLDKALATLNENNPASSNSNDQSQLDSETNF